MADKPTYEELKQRVEELDQVESKYKQLELNLKDSDKKSRAWLEHSPVCTKIIDLDFNLQYMSSAGIEDLGIEDITQYYGKPYPLDFYPESFRNTMTKNLEKVRETGEIITQEADVVDLEGNKVWFHSTIVPVNDEKGRIEYFIVVSVDITDRKQAAVKLQESELKLRESEDFLHKIIINGPEYILVKDLNGKYVVASKSVAEYYGVDLDALIGKTNFDFVSTGKMSILDAERIMKSDLEVINSGKKIILEESVTLSNGSKRWFQTTKVPFVWKGVSEYVLGISIEITERKMNFDLLLEKEMIFKAKNKDLNEFNIALEVLIRQKDNSRLELEKKILSTMKLRIDPYLGQLGQLCSKPVNKNLIEIIKTNLKDIISPFTLKLSSEYINLTSSEIQVADFIKYGLRNKEIAETMNISPETVAVHRKHIRKKMGINNTKTNLNTYLKTLM
jgi:PAS domain S-box-containing protein